MEKDENSPTQKVDQLNTWVVWWLKTFFCALLFATFPFFQFSIVFTDFFHQLFLVIFLEFYYDIIPNSEFGSSLFLEQANLSFASITVFAGSKHYLLGKMVGFYSISEEQLQRSGLAITILGIYPPLSGQLLPQGFVKAEFTTIILLRVSFERF